MRLLNTTTANLHEFHEGNIPPYAILSHRWEREEISYDVFKKGLNVPSRGHQKVLNLCQRAKLDGFDYCWIDTCCIDKSSSTELSEAINSMFRWYQNADLCYSYLLDVSSDEDPAVMGSSFRKSSWFTRGWTLQELLAPPVVYFLGSDWQEIGSRDSLLIVIADITSIDVELFRSGNISDYSIAQRMSWASKRRTTRREDEAYCLMGIFDIHMPLLYGEGDMAFRRLQEEIIRRSQDNSILAHSFNSFCWIEDAMAVSPVSFQRCGNLQKVDLTCVSERQQSTTTIDRGASITSKGIEITVPLVDTDIRGPPHRYYSTAVTVGATTNIALLGCGENGQIAGIYLQKNGVGCYKRCRPFGVGTTLVSPALLQEARMETIILRQGLPFQHRSRQWVNRFPNAGGIVLFKFPLLSSSGFDLTYVEAGNMRLMHRSCSELQLGYPMTAGFAGQKTFVLFSDSELQGFVISVEPQPKCLNPVLYSNVRIARHRQRLEDLVGLTRGIAGEQISAFQQRIVDIGELKVNTRKGPERWVVQISINPPMTR